MQWIQQPDYFIDLILLADNPSQAHVPPAFAERDSPAPLTPPRPFRTDSTNHYEAGTPSIPVATPTPAFTASHAPMPSTASRQAVEKMKANIWVASKKWTFMDAVGSDKVGFTISWLAIVKFLMISDREDMQFIRADAAQKRINDQHAMLLSELQAGVWTPEKYRGMIRELTNPTPAKQWHQEFPEWPEEWPESSQEI
jgi:hypothetical protein